MFIVEALERNGINSKQIIFKQKTYYRQHGDGKEKNQFDFEEVRIGWWTGWDGSGVQARAWTEDNPRAD